MGLFFKKKKENKPVVETRDELLAKNANVPFDAKLKPTSKYGAKLAYNYSDVYCTITGNASGLKEGAVLFAKKNGIIQNAAKEEVAIIENKKLIGMVNDFYDKDRFETLAARFVKLDNGKLLCNLGFYLDNNPSDDDEDDESEDDE